MGWSDLTFTGCTVLTAAQLNQMQANFAAVAGGAPGAPPLTPTSLQWTGQASGATLRVSSGGTFRQLGVTDQASLGGVTVSSQWTARTMILSEQGSAAGLTVSSLATVEKLLVRANPSGTPDANTLYRGLIPKAWLHYDQTGTPVILDEENVSGVSDDATGIFTPSWDRDFSGADAYAALGTTSQDGGGLTQVLMYNAAPAAGSVQFVNRNGSGSTNDKADNLIVAFGRQA
ncbi:MAG TPA: hypothetical protein VF678_00035 [bacterium]